MYDCIIIGAGPAGCYLAEKLAGYNFKILILEEHGKIGFPIHCTGIVSEELIEEFGINNSCIRRRIDSVKVHFPSGDFLNLPTPIRPYILDRERFDRDLADRASAAGAEIRLDSRAVRIEPENNHAVVHFTGYGGETAESARIVIIACGSMSNLPFDNGISSEEKDYRSAQIDVKMKNIDGIELFLGADLAPGSFAYAVSTNGSAAKIGLITKNNTSSFFEKLLKMPEISSRIMEIEDEPTFRRMPFGLPGNTVKGRVVAVGDAARQLKTTTGGGVYYGMLCANILADTIMEAWDDRDFNLMILNEYDIRWKKRFKTELTTGLALRSLLENIDDRWWNGVKDVLKDPKITRLIKEYRQFDCHYRFIFDFFRLPAAGKYLLDLIRANLHNGEALIKFWACH